MSRMPIWSSVFLRVSGHEANCTVLATKLGVPRAPFLEWADSSIDDISEPEGDVGSSLKIAVRVQ